MFISLTTAAPALAMAQESHLGSKLTASLDDDECGTLSGHPPIPHGLDAAAYSSRFEQAALNPQPLPPGPEGASLQLGGRADLDDDWCGTVPRHFPPMPPHIADLLDSLQ